jgi:Multicopper oxidase
MRSPDEGLEGHCPGAQRRAHARQSTDPAQPLEDFDGLFVMHCRILHHEDKGMMVKVEIVK